MRESRATIRRIQEKITCFLNENGYNVFIDFSNMSRSRYLYIPDKEGDIVIRISDHSLSKGRSKISYDIHTTRQRFGSISCEEFIEEVKNNGVSRERGRDLYEQAKRSFFGAAYIERKCN